MGKRLIQQARGKGGPRYKSNSFKFAGKVSYNNYKKDDITKGKIIDIVHSRGHSAPLLKVKYENGRSALLPSFVGAYIGKEIEINQKEEKKDVSIEVGNAYMLKNIPEGTQVFNIEITPGDSGRLVKSGGSFATIVSHSKGKTKILLPSKKEKFINSNSRAFIGIIGGGGRLEKPFLKAGAKHHFKQKKNKLYPRISGVAQSAVDHPHGGSRSLRKGRPTQAPKNAPPGRKVGMIRPRHSGRNK